MGKRLYVGGLPFSTTTNELRDLFTKCGQVDNATIITDKFTGQSRGFGFVEMVNDEEASKAIQELNGQEFGGRSLTVNEARPREERPRGAGPGMGRGGYGGGGGRGDRRDREAW